MGSTRALPGRCAWPLANGGRCTKKPRQGFERCALHKGVEDRERQTKADRTPGSYLKGLAGRGAARLAEMMDDPELLNVRRPAALHAMSLDHVPFDPSPQLLEELARSNAARRLGVNLTDLDPAAVAEVDRFEARIRTHKIASRAAADHAEVINQAKRAAGAEEVARALPRPRSLTHTPSRSRYYHNAPTRRMVRMHAQKVQTKKSPPKRATVRPKGQSKAVPHNAGCASRSSRSSRPKSAAQRLCPCAQHLCCNSRSLQ